MSALPKMDELGNPLVQITGCPNCGKRDFDWMSGLRYSGLCNAGADPNGPCSRRCQLQLEFAAEREGRRTPLWRPA